MAHNFAKYLTVAAALTLPLGVAATAEEDVESTQELSKGEVELAEMLEGYEAGEPVKCLNRSQRDRLRMIDRTALVFRDGKTLYVNRTSSPRYIDDFDIPVFKPFGSSLCRLDQVEFIDRFGGFGGPIAFMKDFVPYTKVENES